MDTSNELFSFHLAQLPLARIPSYLWKYAKGIPGLRHSERFITMNLGAAITSSSRYNFENVAFFAWWKEEKFLNEFLDSPSGSVLSGGWQVRMKLYRRWGQISDLIGAAVSPEVAKPDRQVVAVTLARLKLRHTARFINWGMPVESQVRDHPGQNLAFAAFRPLNTFSTFSVWKNEAAMIDMVRGRHPRDGDSHKLAMQERQREDFHHEFTTLRFAPFKELGTWKGKHYLESLPGLS